MKIRFQQCAQLRVFNQVGENPALQRSNQSANSESCVVVGNGWCEA